MMITIYSRWDRRVPNPVRVSRPRRSAHTPAANGSKWIRPSTRWAIYHRDNFRCLYCQAVGPLSLDHVHSVEKTKKGNGPEDLVTACLRCNSKKQALTKRAWFAKLRDLGIDTTAVRRRLARARTQPIDRAVGRLLAGSRPDAYADDVADAIEQARAGATPVASL